MNHEIVESFGAMAREKGLKEEEKNARHLGELGIGINYADHAAESGSEKPSFPPTFTKFPTCIAGPNDVVELPSAFVIDPRTRSDSYRRDEASTSVPDIAAQAVTHPRNGNRRC